MLELHHCGPRGAFPGASQVYRVAPAILERWEALQGHTQKGEPAWVEGADPHSPLLPPKRVSSSPFRPGNLQAYIVAVARENTHGAPRGLGFSAKGQAGLLGSLDPVALCSAPKPTLLAPPHPQRVLQGPECLRQQHRVPEKLH